MPSSANVALAGANIRARLNPKRRKDPFFVMIILVDWPGVFRLPGWTAIAHRAAKARPAIHELSSGRVRFSLFPVITEFTVEGFKSFGSPASRARLEPLTFVVGANASGKSNLLLALKFLRQCF